MNCVRLTHSASIDSKIDRLGSVRGKVGWSFGPDWLIYGTGGVAFAHVKNTVTSDESSVAPTLMMICWDPSASSGTSIFGWTAGAGIDWKWRMDQGSALVFGVEYLHYGFGDHSVTFQTTQAGGIPTLFGSGGNTFSMTTHDNVDVVKARISYLFSIH